ncbi:hypothetical protein LRS71_07450 [Rhodococcus pyridinivorans]|uniref:hypothetical protein n=1 Tax=Rhodococcus pyridinivorans TaxID=103816 RepID=UPI001E544E29|nr:hypothetical protein [Rhodococcus pyridinivorans]MCD5419396.1 hypothetical protein [Rhodococcus pyridinivorans]
MPPSRDEPRGLLDAMLTHRHDSLTDALAATGRTLAPPIVPAAAVTGSPTRELVVELDASAELPSPAGWRPVRYQVDCTAEDLEDVLAITAPAPLVVYPHVPDAALADAARALTEAGHIPGLTAGRGGDAVADFLSVLAHADTGYAARATGTDDVVALLSATVAALSGFDVREALGTPDVARLRRLVPEAAAAVREILLVVEVDDTDAVVRELEALDLTTD